MKKIVIGVIVAAAVSYGLWDIIGYVKGRYTTHFSRTYDCVAGRMVSHEFDSLRLNGRGIKIGVLDAGFGDFRINRWTRGVQVGAYRDFTGGDSTAFFSDEVCHGTQVCANIGGFSGDTIRGLAWGATYYLAKTDTADREPRAEEQQFIRGVEWLLSHDVDIINSSLAYNLFDDFEGYNSTMLDGGTSTLSRYLDSLLMARPDLVFVQSAGNEGDEPWRYICFPGDVRGVITVGATDDNATARYRSSGVGRAEVDYLKPDFAVPAAPIGTSFSTPIITGLCACVLEYRHVDRDSLVHLLRRSATRAATPDREVGYGMPQTAQLLELLQH